LKDIRAALPSGRMILMTGLVGSGKTVLMRRLYTELEREGRIIVSRSLSIEKKRVTLPSLISALFYDISPDKEPIIPTQGEKRERALQALIRQGRKPVALFVDEAHDLHHKTLVGLKRLMEVVTDGGGSLSILLLGHPKLRNDLRRPTMEEVGYRATMFAYDGVMGHQREYITWLLRTCAAADTQLAEIIDDAAIELLAARLRTPLQIEQHLVLAFEEAFRTDVKPITAEVVEFVLARHMDDLEPRLVRNGYDIRAVAELIGAKTSEVRLLVQGRLEGDRAREMTAQMMTAGLPV
jgi:type II secretory pathway predicted ATPase ExeA